MLGHRVNKCNVATAATTNKHSPDGAAMNVNFTVTTSEIKRSNVKVDVSLHSSEFQSSSLVCCALH